MGQLRDPVFVATLVRLLDDAPSIRRVALEVLPQITDGPLASDDPGTSDAEEMAHRWKAWYQQQGGVLLKKDERD